MTVFAGGRTTTLEIDISPDGRYVVIGDDSGVMCCDVVTGRALKEQFDDFIVSVAAGDESGKVHFLMLSGLRS